MPSFIQFLFQVETWREKYRKKEDVSLTTKFNSAGGYRFILEVTDVHILLTIRPLDDNGEWGAKCRKVYDLDKNGQRIPDGKGGYKNHQEDTTDWNDKGNAEKWRAA